MAEKIEERFHLETHIPVWKETLTLSPSKPIRKEAVPEEASPEMEQAMLNSLSSIEGKLARLRQSIEEGDKKEIEKNRERLRHMEENLQDIL